MRWRPNSTVATVIERNGRFLLVEEQSNGDTVINQPAGHLESGETLAQAAVREVMEETGWDVELEAYLGLYIYVAPNNQTTYHRHCFIGKAIKQHNDATLDDGIIGPVWLTLEELINTGMARSPLVVQCITDYLDNQRYPLDIIHEHTVND